MGRRDDGEKGSFERVYALIYANANLVSLFAWPKQ